MVGQRDEGLRLLPVLAAALLAAAALLHASVVRSHLETGFVDPLLFTATAWSQLVVAAWILVRPGRLAWLAALAVTVLPAVAWAVSRTVGLPWGTRPARRRRSVSSAR